MKTKTQWDMNYDEFYKTKIQFYMNIITTYSSPSIKDEKEILNRAEKHLKADFNKIQNMKPFFKLS